MAKKSVQKKSAQQASAKKKASRKKAAFAIGVASLPAPGSWVLATPGSPPTIFVRTTGWANGDKAWAKIHPVADAPTAPADPAADLEGFTELTANGTNREGQVEIPAGVTCASTTPASNNITVTIAYREFAAALPTNILERIQFKYICGTFTAKVPAYACPWFAFRQDTSGPCGEDVGIHRPIRICIPANAATVGITATGWWRHSPITAGVDSGGSDPSGRLAEMTPLYEPRYQSESANSSVRPIIALPAPMPVNCLVGVTEPKTLATAPAIVSIGSSLASLPTPTNYNAIHLGFWDGTQWNKASSPTGISNSGEVDVIFTWAP